jgi:very-short-patch-repair endonuclease
VLSHRSAAELWEMLKPTDGPVHVTVPVAGGRRRRSGIVIHRSPYLTSAVTTRRNGIAVTTAARTVRDLQRTSPAREVRRAVREAEFRGLPIGKYGDGSEMTRSELERKFLRLCRRYRLPGPEVNVGLGRFTVDFVWRQERLVVETDGYAAHRGQQAFEDDRRRDATLAAMGYEVLRFTYLQVENRPAQVARVVRARLNARSPTLYSRYP